jgi:hypothetical protein
MTPLRISTLLSLWLLPSALCAALFPPGETVRLTRGEMLLAQGKNHAGAAKGQEFQVVRHDSRAAAVHVAWYQEDDTVLAVTLPADALELCPPEAWSDLLRGVRAFRDGRPDEARRLLSRAARDPQHGALAGALATRIGGGSAPVLRAAAGQLHQLGHLTLALWLDEATDRIPGAPPAQLDRAALGPKVATAQRALHRGRQAIGLRRLTEASRLLTEGLAAEPARPDLAALQKQMAKDLAYAEESYTAANRMRRFEKGAIHALTAIERGLKACADHPKLRELKKAMQSQFEERTSPPVTAAFLSTVKGENAKAALTDGHKLYTTRCTECHDLELVDSRGMEGWQRTVAGMSRRAGLSAAEQARILDYLTAAQRYVEATGER